MSLEIRPGYEGLGRAAQDALDLATSKLALLAQEALNQAQYGKGHLRHGDDGTSWSKQAMAQILAELGPGYSAGQYAKKMAEAMRLEPAPRRTELLGAAVCALATAVYFGEEDG